MTGYGDGQWSVAPLAVHPAPNFALNSLSLWRTVSQTLKPFYGMTSPDMSGAADFAVTRGYNIDASVMNAVITSGPMAALWGNVSGIS